MRQVPDEERLFLLGDFNARVGSDQISWPRCIGHFGVGKLNENGQRLLEFCSFSDLCLTNTFFATKPHHKVSWRHPRSRHWHQLDFIITRRSSLNQVLVTRSFHSADCDTDHSLVVSKVRLLPKRTHCSRQKPLPRINTAGIATPELRVKFAKAIDEVLEDCLTDSATSMWNHIRESVFKTALNNFGKQRRRSEDWFEAGAAEKQPALAATRAALLAHKQKPSEKTLAALRAARSNAQRIARRCANDYWNNLCQNIQQSADMGNVRGMYEGMKKAFGPSVVKTAPLKSADGDIIKDRSKQMDRWAEHYQNLYSTVTTVTDAALEKTPVSPKMEELNEPPSIDELSKAITSLANGKASGSDNIPP